MNNQLKTSLVFAAIASITACGGGSGGGSSKDPSPQTRQITAIDGLLQNAAVFKDTNANLMWDLGEPLIGLTDENGQATVAASTADRIGVVTLVAGSPTYEAIVAQDSAYAGVETIDMDFPTMPMAKQLTFVAPQSTNVLSPYTHLISTIAQQKGIDVDEAHTLLTNELKVNGLEFKLAENYVKANKAMQRKLAQLLTDALAKTPQHVITNWRSFIEEGAIVVSQLSEAELSSPNVRPILDGDSSTPAVSNSLLQLNQQAWDALFEQWQQIGDISAGDSGEFFSIDLNAIDVNGQATPLFIDPDISETPVTYSLMDGWAAGELQDLRFSNRLNVKIEDDGTTLTLYSDNISKAERNDFYLVAIDKDAEGNHVYSTMRTLEIRTSSANGAPTVSDNGQAEIQQLINDTWYLEKGQPFEQTIDVSNWFSDPEDDQLTYHISGSLIDVGLSGNMEHGQLVISGTPVRSYADEGIRHSLTITAADAFNHVTAQVELTLPEIEEGILDKSNPLVGKSWYYIDDEYEDGVIRNHCMYIRFSGGKVTQTLGDVYDYQGCDLAETNSVSFTSYNEVNLTTLTENVIVATKHYTIRYRLDTDKGVAYGVTIDQYAGQDNDQVFMFFSEKSEVEQRLDIDSHDVALEYALPIDGKIVQTSITPEVGSNYVKLQFDNQLNCNQLKSVLQNGQIGGNLSYEFGGAKCIEQQNGVSVDPYYILDFINDRNFTSGLPYFIHFEYEPSALSHYGEPIRLNYTKD